jgi:hypothetical protein
VGFKTSFDASYQIFEETNIESGIEDEREERDRGK